MDQIQESVSGVVPFFLYFVPAILAIMAFMWIYMRLTPYNEVQLIKENNPAAAIAYVGALIGFTLPLASALANSVGFVDFLIWAVIAGVCQLVTFMIFRKFYPLIGERIEKGEMAASVKLAGIAVMVGLINAASITY